MDATVKATTQVTQPIIIDLGRQKAKKLKEFKRGEGELSETEVEKERTLRPVQGAFGSDTRPIVLEYKKLKKKKVTRDKEGIAKYSPELEDVQRVGTEALRVTHKAVKALEKGIDTYERERLRSANEKKDGAIEDAVYNAGKATSVWLKETSDIPVDLAEAVRRSAYGKRLRKRLRRVAKLVRIWRI